MSKALSYNSVQLLLYIAVTGFTIFVEGANCWDGSTMSFIHGPYASWDIFQRYTLLYTSVTD